MSIALAVIVTIFSLAVLAQHGWAYKGHFASDALPPGAIGLTLLVLAAGLANLWALWSGPLWSPAMLAGLILQLASLGLFWITIAASRQARLRLAFDPSLPRGVIRHGPYRLMRHPFYTSYMLFWIGWAVAAWSVWALPPLIAMLATYIGAARMEERNFARSAFAGEYENYRRRTGVLWPRSATK